MSDFEVVIGTLRLYDDTSGDHKLSNGKSFDIIAQIDLFSWVNINYPGGNEPKTILQHATRHSNGKISFVISYYALGDNDSYVGCESSIESHLIKYGIIKEP